MKFKDTENLSLDEIKEAYQKDKEVFEKGHTNKQLANLIKKHNQSIKSITTLSKDFKKDILIDMLFNGEIIEPKEAPATTETKDTRETANTVLEVANSIKEAIHNKPLNAFVKKQSIKVIDKCLTVFSSDTIDKMGKAGLVIGGVMLLIDTFVGMENIKEKFEERKKAKKEALEAQNKQSKENNEK